MGVLIDFDIAISLDRLSSCHFDTHYESALDSLQRFSIKDHRNNGASMCGR